MSLTGGKKTYTISAILFYEFCRKPKTKKAGTHTCTKFQNRFPPFVDIRGFDAQAQKDIGILISTVRWVGLSSLSFVEPKSTYYFNFITLIDICEHKRHFFLSKIRLSIYSMSRVSDIQWRTFHPSRSDFLVSSYLTIHLGPWLTFCLLWLDE